MLFMLANVGLCAQVMLDDVCTSYDALRVSKTPRLPMVRLQYPDFATWQAMQLLSSSVLQQVRPSDSVATCLPHDTLYLVTHLAWQNICLEPHHVLLAKFGLINCPGGSAKIYMVMASEACCCASIACRNPLQRSDFQISC